MRTTVDLPDPVFRRLKAMAALQRTSLQAIILRAVEREIRTARRKKRRMKFPLIHSKEKTPLFLTSAEIDDLLLG